MLIVIQLSFVILQQGKPGTNFLIEIVHHLWQ